LVLMCRSITSVTTDYRLTLKFYFMKQIKSISALMLLVTVLFTACTKDSTTAPQDLRTSPNPLKAAAIAGDNGMAQVTYNLTTLPVNSSSIINWARGYVTLNSVAFDAVLVNNARFLVNYSTSMNNQSFQLFGTANLGTISVPPGTYDDVKYRLVLSNAKSDIPIYAFYLTGSYMVNNMTVPVEFIVNDPIQLDALGGSGMPIRVQSYTPALVFDPNRITLGVTANMLNAATISNGTMRISSTENQNIYGTMLENLLKALSVKSSTTTRPMPDITTAQPVPLNQ
jgi:hypothetical protein